MSKRILTSLLSILFLLFIVAPTVLLVIDDSVNASLFYSVTEEEEKGSELNIEVEPLFFELISSSIIPAFLNAEDNLEFFLKKHPKPHLNLISPPPDSHII